MTTEPRNRVDDVGHADGAIDPEPFEDEAIVAQIFAELSRVEAAHLEWVSNPAGVDFDDRLVETLVGNVNAHAEAWVRVMNRKEQLPSYSQRLRSLGTALIEQHRKHGAFRDPYSDSRLRQIAESSGDFILRKSGMTIEQQEAEILKEIERCRMQLRSEAGEWRQRCNQMVFRIETLFEARYRYWRAEAIERIGSRDQAPGKKRGSARNRWWEQVEIIFLSDERVETRIGDQFETRNYEELGFADRRSGKPNLAWMLLVELSGSSGKIPYPPAAGRAWGILTKKVQRTRRLLQKHFGIKADPLPHVEGIGYRARFQITRALAFDT